MVSNGCQPYFFSVYAKERKVKGIRENTCYYWLSEGYIDYQNERRHGLWKFRSGKETGNRREN